MRLLLPLMLLTGCDVLLDGGLAERSHPCVGNRTDTLWLDDASAAWVGCGSTTSGQGLYRTTDAGRTWQAVAGFDDFRVSSIHRAPDGVLYVAGTEPGGARVVALGPGDARDPVLESQSQTWNSFHVGTYRQDDAGRAIAESLTGTDLAFRPGPDAAFQDGGAWAGSGGFQLLDLEVGPEGFVGVGSTITQPPTVFVERDVGEGLLLEPTALGDGVTGELWAVDGDGDGWVVGGVDQEADIGLIATTNGDPADPATWSLFAVDAVVDGQTWIRGVCRDGNRVVAAGESRGGRDGLLLESTDGGASWRDITPLEAPPLSTCVLDHGVLAVAGGSGFFGIDGG